MKIKIVKEGLEKGYVDYLEFRPTALQKRSAQNESLPMEYRLYDNYPNPFNPLTTIAYDLPEARRVKLNIYNIAGQLVTTLVDEQKQAGRHKTVWRAEGVSTGLYFYELKAGDFYDVKKMMLLK